MIYRKCPKCGELVPNAPIAELDGKVPVVLYFNTNEEAKEFEALWRTMIENPVEVQL